MSKKKLRFTNFIKAGLTILISVLAIFAVVKASTNKITPPSGTPTATFYSLSEIYYFIASSTTATAGSPALDWSSALEDTGYTLTEIYNALAGLISADKVKLGTTYLNVAGTLVPSGGTATTTDVFNDKTFFGASQSNWTLQTGTLKLACATSTFDGTGNLVADGYDGDGNGANRWCMATSTNSASASQILSGYNAWVNGIELSGTISTQTLSNTTTTINAGYYASTTLEAADTDLATGNIKSGITIFGVAGDSNVVDTSSGNATAANIATGTIAWVDGTALTGTFDPWTPQWLQTKDDWVNSGGTSGEYTGEEAVWSAVAGSPFAGYNSINYSTSSLDLYSGTVKQDTRTGLWWSDIAAIDGGGTATTTSNSFTLSADGSRPTDGDAIGFCNALNTANFGGYNNWYLPTQKELQQAYIDGSANNLPYPDAYFWSSSETSWDSTTAWRVGLYHGYAYGTTKTTKYYVRCVRRP